MKKILIIFIFTCCLSYSYAQKESKISQTLDSLAVSSIPQLNNQVDISFSNISIKELVWTLGSSTGLNITIDQSISYTVNANFNQVKASNVLAFLCDRYNLELKSHGNIIHLQPRQVKEDRLLIDVVNDTIVSYDVKKIKADEFFREFTNKTNLNFILSPEINNFIINGYAQHINLYDALTQLAASNKLSIIKKSGKLFSVEPALNKPDVTISEQLPPGRGKKKQFELEYKDELVNAEINDTPVSEILNELALQSGYSIFMLSPMEEKASVSAKYTGIQGFLNNLFYGTENTYRIEGNAIYTGNRKLPGIKSCELIKLYNRRVDSLTQIIPQQIKKDLTIQEYAEQNSLIAWGDADIISQFKTFLEKIDVVIPVILIDVIIVDAGKNFEIETGLKAGIGSEPAETKGDINPGLDFTMNANSTNKLLGRIGLTNLGKVTPNFYVKLKAMESDGILEIRSTPQLSTLNGHSATMSIGQTEYYKEELSNIYGYQNPQMQTQYQYKPVEANMDINIKPFITGNGQVSLNISVEQSEFTERIADFAPPGLKSRKFQSMIRVKNQEMILLGGLEENVNSSTRKGWPFLSKVPVLNWIFTSKSEKKSKSHLNIFIKPTVIY